MATKKPVQRKPRAKKPVELKYDLACGQSKREGFIGIDLVKSEGVDMVFDLEAFPWPLESDTADELHASHYIEHVHDLLAFFDEAWRVCKDGAIFTIICPYYTSIRAWQDPTHVRAISEATFQYFTREWRESQKLDHYPVQCDWEIESLTAAYNPPWHLKSEEARMFAQQHYFNVISDITVVLKAKKPEAGTT